MKTNAIKMKSNRDITTPVSAATETSANNSAISTKTIEDGILLCDMYACAGV